MTHIKKRFLIWSVILLFNWNTPLLSQEAKRANDSPVICNGRLTLTSGTPVTTSDVFAATTVYFTPYNGSKIALYSGTIWQLISFSEVSVSVPSNTNTPFDIFGYNNNGTLALEALAWTNDTTRATDLTTQDGVYVKTGATTRRYLGTGRTTGVSGQTEDSQAKRFLWNNFNRVGRSLYIAGTGAGYTYTTAAWRSVNGDDANRVQIVVGLAESSIPLQASCWGTNTLGAAYYLGIGVDTNAGATGAYGVGSTTTLNTISSSINVTPAKGGHYYQMVEYSVASGTTTWYCASSYGYIQGRIEN